MLYLIQQSFLWLLLTAAAAGVAGWAWHKWKHDGALAELDKKREALRRELVSLVNGDPAYGLADADREREMARTSLELKDGEIADLRRQLEEARSAREEAITQVAELRRAGERETIESDELIALRAQAAETERARQSVIDVEAEAQPDAAMQRWRMRYLEGRVRHLEGLQIPVADPPLRADLDAAQARVAELETQLGAMAAPNASADEVNAWRWQARYLEARVNYLERTPAPEPVVVEAAPAEPSADEVELANRARWRALYLEKRLGYLEEAFDGAMTRVSDERDAAQARIAQLEPLEPEAARARRLGWRARYLGARVTHLEEMLAAAQAAPPAPQPVAAEVEDAPPEPGPVLVPAGAEERPPSLPAARDGAPEDLTLIESISPMQHNTLNFLGVYHFDQIAAWTPANVAWVDQYLRLRGRITRERWVEQAGVLARGDVRTRQQYVREDA